MFSNYKIGRIQIDQTLYNVFLDSIVKDYISEFNFSAIWPVHVRQLLFFLSNIFFDFWRNFWHSEGCVFVIFARIEYPIAEKGLTS